MHSLSFVPRGFVVVISKFHGPETPQIYQCLGPRGAFICLGDFHPEGSPRVLKRPVILGNNNRLGPLSKVSSVKTWNISTLKRFFRSPRSKRESLADVQRWKTERVFQALPRCGRSTPGLLTRPARLPPTKIIKNTVILRDGVQPTAEGW